MILRRTIIAAAFVLAAVPAGASATSGDVGIATGEPGAEPIGSCGGFAPVYPTCSFLGLLPASSTVHLEAQPEFTGRISVVLTTGSGTYSASCDFLGVLDPVCRSATSGVLQIGQTFDVSAAVTAFNPADGSDLGRAAVGRWRVYVTAQ